MNTLFYLQEERDVWDNLKKNNIISLWNQINF